MTVKKGGRYIIRAKIPGLLQPRYFNILAGFFVSWDSDERTAKRLSLPEVKELMRSLKRRQGEAWKIEIVKVSK